MTSADVIASGDFQRSCFNSTNAHRPPLRLLLRVDCYKTTFESENLRYLLPVRGRTSAYFETPPTFSLTYVAPPTQHMKQYIVTLRCLGMAAGSSSAPYSIASNCPETSGTVPDFYSTNLSRTDMQLNYCLSRKPLTANTIHFNALFTLAYLLFT